MNVCVCKEQEMYVYDKYQQMMMYSNIFFLKKKNTYQSYVQNSSTVRNASLTNRRHTYLEEKENVAYN